MSALDVNYWDDDATAFSLVAASAEVTFWDEDAAAFSPATAGVEVNFWDEDAASFSPAVAGTEVNFWDDECVCPPTPSSEPPVVTVVSPPAQTAITAQTYVVFDVVDDSALFRRIIVMASFPLLDVLDVVHDGDKFGPAYSQRSQRTTITNGYRYTLVRNGGWPASPTIVPYAIDRDGNENQ